MTRNLIDFAAVCLGVIALAWLGPIVLDDGPARSYASYGYTGEAPRDAITDAIEASRLADQHQCEALHGPHAVAAQRPDGSHRCVDKRGRPLPRSVITIPGHEIAGRAP